MLRCSKRRFFNNITNADKKTFWKSVKVLNKNRVTIPSLNLDDIAAVSDDEKANMLSNFFARCWNSLNLH